MQGKRNAFPGVGGPAPAAPVPAPTLPTPAPPAQPGVGATIYEMLSRPMPGMGNKAGASAPRPCLSLVLTLPHGQRFMEQDQRCLRPYRSLHHYPDPTHRATVPPLVAAVAAANKTKTDPNTLPEVERPSGPPTATKVTTPSFGGYYQEPPKPKKGEAGGEKAPTPQ